MIKKLIFLFFMCLSLALSAETTSGSGTDTFIIGKPGSGLPIKLKSRDGGYIKKGFNGEWYISDDGISEKVLGEEKKTSSSFTSNLSINASVSSNALTVAIKGQDGNSPSASNVVQVAFRSSTETSGNFSVRNITNDLSIVVSSGSTLGQVSGQSRYIYVYAIDSAGTVELAVSSSLYIDNSIVSTVAEGGAGGADSASAIYSTTARSNVPIRRIGRLKSLQTTAGTWATPISQIKLGATDSYKYVSCVLRYTAGAWECLNGAGHTPVGISSVTTNPTYAALYFDFTASNVLSFIVVPDETLAVRGISAGASVGLSSAAIEFSRVASDISGLIQYNGSAWTCTGCTGNLSIGSFSGGGVLTVNHDAASDYSISVSSLGGTYVPILGSLTSTTTSIAWPATYGGSYVSTPNTNLKAYFSRKTNGYGVKTLSSSDLEIASGNFFVYGIFEE